MARPARRIGVPVVVALLLVGCAVPVPEPPGAAAPAPAQGDEGTRLTTEDTGGAALATQLAALDGAVASVAAALGAASTAAAAGDVAAARTAGATAVDLLLGTGDAGDAGDAGNAGAAVAVLPTAAVDRSGDGADDLITATVTLAGDVGGERARVVLELVRDPLVGDLGAWQRDAPGVVDGVRATVAAAGADPAALDAGLDATAGELTRALGYALAVAAAPDAELAAHAAAAGTARLAVVRVALELGTAAVADAGA